MLLEWHQNISDKRNTKNQPDNEKEFSVNGQQIKFTVTIERELSN